MCIEHIVKPSPVMSNWSGVLNIFLAPTTRSNLLQQNYDREIKTHLKKEFDHNRLRNAPVVTLTSFSVFEYMDQYPIFFQCALSSWYVNSWNELHLEEIHGKLSDTAVAGCAKRWNAWGVRCVLDCRCVGEKSNSFVCMLSRRGLGRTMDGRTAGMSAWARLQSSINPNWTIMLYC